MPITYSANQSTQANQITKQPSFPIETETFNPFRCWVNIENKDQPFSANER